MALFTRIFEYFDMPIEIENAPDAITPETAHGEITFDLSLHVADGLDLGDHVGALAGLVADDHAAFLASAEALGVGVRTLCAAHVGSGDGQVLELHSLDAGDEHLARVHMVHGDVKEALDLVCVKVAGHDAVTTGSREQVGDKRCSDCFAGTVLTFLAGPAEIRHDRNHLVRRGALGSIYGEQEFHKVVCRRYGRLDDEYRCAAYALGKTGLEFSVAERSDLQIAEVYGFLAGTLNLVQVLDYVAGEVLGSTAGKNFYAMGVDHSVLSIEDI